MNFNPNAPKRLESINEEIKQEDNDDYKGSNNNENQNSLNTSKRSKQTPSSKHESSQQSDRKKRYMEKLFMLKHGTGGMPGSFLGSMGSVFGKSGSKSEFKTQIS